MSWRVPGLVITGLQILVSVYQLLKTLYQLGITHVTSIYSPSIYINTLR